MRKTPARGRGDEGGQEKGGAVPFILIGSLRTRHPIKGGPKGPREQMLNRDHSKTNQGVYRPGKAVRPEFGPSALRGILRKPIEREGNRAETWSVPSRGPRRRWGRKKNRS